MDVQFLRTSEMVADFLTKPLQGAAFKNSELKFLVVSLLPAVGGREKSRKGQEMSGLAPMT